MATISTPKMTAEEFFEWANRPENEAKWLELDHGEVVEVPPPKHPHGVLCWLVTAILTKYVDGRGSGYLCINDTGIVVERSPDTVRGADVILFLKSKTWDQIQPKYVEDVPDLIVEVLSPQDRPGKTTRRVGQYLRRGVPLVWVIDPEDRLMTVYRPDEFPKVLDETDELLGNGVLPDFRCRVAGLFSLPGQAQP